MKSIIIINQYIGSPYHGMEYRHYYLAKNLIQQGYKVTLISGSYSHLFSTLPRVKSCFTKENIDEINYIWIKLPKYKSSKSIGRIWNMVYFTWRLRFLKDLETSHIIVSSPSLFPIKVAKKWAKKFKSKLFFEVRDIWPLTLVELSNLTSSHPLIKIMRNYETFAYKNCDKVISLLPNAKEYFNKNGMQNDKYLYLPNGIEIQNTPMRSLSKDILEKIPKDKFIIAYSGTVGIANNLDYLVNVANLLIENKKIHFIILGKGGEKNRLEEKVRELKLKNFTFLDAICKEEVGIFLEKVDVAFISLLKEEIFKFGVSPNKIFDYMYARKPIIWAIEAGNNLVEEAECGVSVLLNNPARLKEVILELHSLSEEALQKLGENGYNFVIKNNSYEALSKKLIRVLEE